MTKDEYNVVYAVNIADLKLLVNEKTEEGWRVHGNLVVVAAPSGCFNFFQPVVKGPTEGERFFNTPVPKSFVKGEGE